MTKVVLFDLICGSVIKALIHLSVSIKQIAFVLQRFTMLNVCFCIQQQFLFLHSVSFMKGRHDGVFYVIMAATNATSGSFHSIRNLRNQI